MRRVKEVSFSAINSFPGIDGHISVLTNPPKNGNQSAAYVLMDRFGVPWGALKPHHIITIELGNLLHPPSPSFTPFTLLHPPSLHPFTPSPYLRRSIGSKLIVESNFMDEEWRAAVWMNEVYLHLLHPSSFTLHRPSSFIQ